MSRVHSWEESDGGLTSLGLLLQVPSRIPAQGMLPPKVGLPNLDSSTQVCTGLASWVILDSVSMSSQY